MMGKIEITDTDFNLWLLISRAQHFILKIRKRELKPYVVTPLQVYVLFIISKLGREATLTEIAKHVNREIHTISMLISRMEKDGLIIKRRDTPKSTLIRFEITDKGQKACKLLDNAKSYKEVFSVLSEKERQQFVSIMDKLLNKTRRMLSEQT
ncbi:MAG: MarR family transcriptional regulator [Dehalococcoidales bacterium]|nr:MarR family transcriptional regulator [Dehalococcoidales bacterium]